MKERSTGKSTFIKWLTSIFGLKMTYIKGDSFNNQFNSDWALMLIVAIDEVFFDKKEITERLNTFPQLIKTKKKPKKKIMGKLNFSGNSFFVLIMKTILFRLMRKKFRTK